MPGSLHYTAQGASSDSRASASAGTDHSSSSHASTSAFDPYPYSAPLARRRPSKRGKPIKMIDTFRLSNTANDRVRPPLGAAPAAGLEAPGTAKARGKERQQKSVLRQAKGEVLKENLGVAPAASPGAGADRDVGIDASEAKAKGGETIAPTLHSDPESGWDYHRNSSKISGVSNVSTSTTTVHLPLRTYPPIIMGLNSTSLASKFLPNVKWYDNAPDPVLNAYPTRPSTVIALVNLCVNAALFVVVLWWQRGRRGGGGRKRPKNASRSGARRRTEREIGGKRSRGASSREITHSPSWQQLTEVSSACDSLSPPSPQMISARTATAAEAADGGKEGLLDWIKGPSRASRHKSVSASASASTFVIADDDEPEQDETHGLLLHPLRVARHSQPAGTAGARRTWVDSCDESQTDDDDERESEASGSQSEDEEEEEEAETEQDGAVVGDCAGTTTVDWDALDAFERATGSSGSGSGSRSGSRRG